MNLRRTAFSGGGAKISFFQSSLLIQNGKNIDRYVEDKELFIIWKNICLPKVELIVWMPIQNCISAKSVLVRRGILDNSHNICPLCNIEEESLDHLLLLCNVARKVWDEIFVWWQMTWNCQTTFKGLFLSWDSIRFKNLERICWQATFYAVVWSIWLCT